MSDADLEVELEMAEKGSKSVGSTGNGENR